MLIFFIKRCEIMNGYQFKLVYIVCGSCEIKWGNNKTQLEVFARRTMKTSDYTIIDMYA